MRIRDRVSCIMKFSLMKIRNVERGISSFMGWFLLWAILAFDFMLKVSGNPEGDALYALKNNLADPNNVLQNWDPTEINHCMWFRVRCNNDNSVTRLDLGGENLSGELVPQLGQLSNLQHLLLYSNNISGKIPYEFGKLTNLVSLDLYMNRLTGPIPDTLGNLEKLRFLRLNNNGLSENIPMSLTTVASLQVLDLSNNQLKGDIPVDGSFSLFTSTSFENNPGLKQRKFSPPPPIRQMPSAPSGNSATAAIASGVAVGIALAFAVPAIALAYWRRDRYFDVPAENPNEIQDQVKQFSLLDLQIATSNFSETNILGRGGYGKVYKGRLSDGSLVAVKRLHQLIEGGEVEFQRELLMINRAVHRNLLRLHGFCVTPNERIIVYPFMVNGSVASHLRERLESQPPLDWPTRKHITLGVARGLAYLHEHCDPKIIHRDVKAANIMLDEEFEAVVGDFGLSKHIDYKDTHATTRVCGTFGYLAPEYAYTTRISEKVDVFAYGVILLELITGQMVFDRAQLANDKDFYLLNWVKRRVKDKRWETLADVDLQGNYDEEEVKQLIQVALLCTQNYPTRRPKMSEVVRMLEGCDLAEKWEQYCQREETRGHDFNNFHYASSAWIVDSTSFIQPEELSGPR